ncbi:cysteine peptidase family C39 domain-containing protein [Enterococcus faecium]|nr:cysteine peptidase family C39 domain-containing protein [Enterococcus faecium]
MIVENYFKKISICEIRPLIKNTKMGTSFFDLKKGLKRLGVDCKIFAGSKALKTF